MSLTTIEQDTAQRVLEELDREADRHVRFLQELLRIRSVWGDGPELTRAAEHLAGELTGAGVPAALTECGTGGMFNVQATLGPTTDDGLIFNGHMEVYPPSTSWTRDPFGADVVDGAVYGVGVADMKAGTAAMTAAVATLARLGLTPARGVTILAVPNHFEGGEGTRQALRDGLRARYAINCEPSDLQVLLGQRGIAYVNVTAHGRAAHTTALDIGVNAIDRATRVVQAVLGQPMTDPSGAVLDDLLVCNVAQITGGVAHNLIPERCDVTFDFRFPPEQDQDCVLRDVRSAVARALPDLAAFGVDVSLEPTCVKNPRSSLRVPADADVITTLSGAHRLVAGEPARYATHRAWPDTPIFWEAGIQAATYGPGSMDCYWDDESVRVADYLGAIKAYALAALDLAY